jgi:hypothetical protein
MIRFTCGLLVRFVCTTAGASAPGFPCALVFNKGEIDGKTSGASRRENADVYLLAVGIES